MPALYSLRPKMIFPLAIAKQLLKDRPASECAKATLQCKQEGGAEANSHSQRDERHKVGAYTKEYRGNLFKADQLYQRHLKLSLTHCEPPPPDISIVDRICTDNENTAES